MTREEEFIEWLEEQDYWVKHKKVENNWSDVELEDMRGITMIENENGETLVPATDYMRAARRGVV